MGPSHGCVLRCQKVDNKGQWPRPGLERPGPLWAHQLRQQLQRKGQCVFLSCQLGYSWSKLHACHPQTRHKEKGATGMCSYHTRDTWGDCALGRTEVGTIHCPHEETPTLAAERPGQGRLGLGLPAIFLFSLRTYSHCPKASAELACLSLKETMGFGAPAWLSPPHRYLQAACSARSSPFSGRTTETPQQCR